MQNFYLHRDGQNLGPYTKEDLYQTDAFGNVFNGGSKGAAIKKAKFAQRFSTKYQDGETGLVYFGYRYDGPAFGRWVRYFLHG